MSLNSKKSDNSSSPKIITNILFALNIFLSILGFSALTSSPYTGIRTTVKDESAVIKVDDNSPAQVAGLKDGDVLVDVEDLSLPFYTFVQDPDYVKDRKEYNLIWESLAKLDEKIDIGRQVNIKIKRETNILNFTLVPRHFPILQAIKRTSLSYIVAWTFMLIGFLVLRKKYNDISIANFTIATTVCTSFASLAPYTVRDLSYPYFIFRILKESNYFGALISSFAFLHLILVFPRKRRLLERYPHLVKVLYILCLLVISIHYSGIFNNMHLTSYLPITLTLSIFIICLIIDFFKENDIVYKRQIQWVVFGFAIGLFGWLIFISIPILFGAPILSEEMALLPSIAIPLSLAFAITRYKLMDIDTIFDYIVIYGLTILILEIIELSFLGIISPYISAYIGQTPFISVVAVLLIVFLYVPIRNIIKKAIERIFKRGDYDIEKEILKFNISISLNKGNLPFEPFFNFIKKLIGSSGCIVLSNSKSLLYSDSERTNLIGHSLINNENTMNYLSNLRQQVFGFEIIDEGVDINDSLKGALFVPITTSKDTYIFILLEKWNNTPYSNKDRILISTISLNLSQLLEVEQLRIEKALLEEELNKQKSHILKEMHDGLGSILTHIIVASQVAKNTLNKDKDKMANMIDIIHNCSREAMDFMRAGLSLLENPRSTIGNIVSQLRHRYRSLLESYGIEAYYILDESIESEHLGAKETLNCIRSIQEAINNILKHSGANKIELQFTKNKNTLNITIKDNGKGFDITKSNNGSGIKNMRERMLDIGGTFEIRPVIGRGTEILFSIPIKSPKTVMDDSLN